MSKIKRIVIIWKKKKRRNNREERPVITPMTKMLADNNHSANV